MMRIVLLLTFGILFVYCGSAYDYSTSEKSYGAEGEEAMISSEEGYYEDDYMYAESVSQEMGGASAPMVEPTMPTKSAPKESSAPEEVGTPQPTERMIVYRGNISLQVHTPSETIKAATDLAKQYGGYVSQSSETYIVIRVLAENFNEAFEATQKFGIVLSKEATAQDVTEAYFDLQLRLDNAKQLKIKLQELIKETTNMEDLIRLEKQLGQLSKEINQLELMLRELKDQATYSTITMDLTVVQKQNLESSQYYFGFVKDLGIGGMQ